MNTNYISFPLTSCARGINCVNFIYKVESVCILLKIRTRYYIPTVKKYSKKGRIILNINILLLLIYKTTLFFILSLLQYLYFWYKYTNNIII